MLQRLGEGESPRAEYRKCRGARLTVEGRTRAVEMVRHHRLIELYLRQELGYSLDEVRAQAETLEHAISETLEDRLAAKLDFTRQLIPTVIRSRPKTARTAALKLQLRLGASSMGLSKPTPIYVTKWYPIAG